MRKLKYNNSYVSSIRVRIAIRITTIFVILLTLSLLIIFFFYDNFRDKEFGSMLKNRALTNFRLLVEVEQVDSSLLHILNKNSLNHLPEERIVIFEDEQIIYNSDQIYKVHVDPRWIAAAIKEKEMYVSKGAAVTLLLAVPYKDHQYVIVASAKDLYGNRLTSFLKWVIVFIFMSVVLVAGSIIYILLSGVTEPLLHLEEQLQNITPDHIDWHLNVTGKGDETDRLAIKFNQLMSRLQNAFSIQKTFVHYVSHEIRTPITSMIRIAEAAQVKDLTTGEYKDLIKCLYTQQLILSDLIDELAVLADQQKIDDSYPLVRLDELIFHLAEVIEEVFLSAKINIKLHVAKGREDGLAIHANEPLLAVAFNNLLKNALQYSIDTSAVIVIRITGTYKEVVFANKGEGVSLLERKMMYDPFFRGRNVKNTTGHGLGLALSKQIAYKHNANLLYSYKAGLNFFTVRFNS